MLKHLENLSTRGACHQNDRTGARSTMNTIQHIGNHAMAGSEHFPTSYRIRACPKCYGVLYWNHRSQTTTTCNNCHATITILPFMGPVDYARQTIRTHPFSRETVLLAFYSFIQLLDHHLRLRKLPLFIFIRGLSYLP